MLGQEIGWEERLRNDLFCVAASQLVTWPTRHMVNSSKSQLVTVNSLHDQLVTRSSRHIV